MTSSLTHRALALAAGALLATAPAAAAQDPAPSPGPVLEGPSARFSWSMPDRYGRSWSAWNATQARYSTAYVRPSRWAVTVDACRSSGAGVPITDYEMTVRGVGTTFSTGSRGTSCRRTFSTLPRLGRYDVRVVVRTRRGTSPPSVQRIELRDHLVVSLGDSMASGEGVPDTPGAYTLPFTPTATLRTLERLFAGEFRPQTIRPVRWQDRRCHRSARAGHALAAEALERRDPHSSVTFVSLACSGAEIEHLIDTDYAGIQSASGAEKLDPQLAVLREQVGRSRRIEALLLSIGINDLGFSGIVKSCAMNFNGATGVGDADCVWDAGVATKLDPDGPLEQSYAELDAAMSQGLDIAEVYVTDYPAAPFGAHRGGCRLLGIPRFGIAAAEAEAMHTTGIRLWWAIGRAAAARGWNYVPEMTEAFTGHDYCSSSPYLMGLEASIAGQGTIDGAVHPNRTGHARLGDMLARALVFRPTLPHWHARVVVEAVRVDAGLQRRALPEPPGDDPDQTPTPPPPSDRFGFEFGVFETGNWPVRTSHRFTIPKTAAGRWVTVPADVGTFDLDVYDAPRPPRYLTGVDFIAHGPGGTLGGGGTLAQRFGSGCHTRAHPAGWQMRFRIDVVDVTSVTQAPAPGVPCTNAAAG